MMSKKQQLIESSYQLFYQNGFHACGVDLLAQHAGVTKRTLYSYFGSKDGLIAATLAYRHRQFMDAMQAVLANYAIAETGAGYLDFLNGWIQSADFYGCMFINACAEYASPENPLHIQAAAHKEAVQAVLLARFQAAGFSQAEAMAALLFIGGEGLIVSAQTGGTQHIGRYGDLIRQAVADLAV